MKNIEKYNWIIPIVEKHFLEMTKEIEKEAILEDKLLNYFRIGEIQEDLEITIANLLGTLKK